MIPNGLAPVNPPIPAANSVTLRSSLIRDTRPGVLSSVNHSRPSGPVVISAGSASALKPGVAPGSSSLTLRSSLTRATPPSASVNHARPSGPMATPRGTTSAVKPGVTPPTSSVTVPSKATRAIRPGSVDSATQMLASGPSASPHGAPLSGNSVTLASALTRAT